jgi:hypothetical protein
LLDGCVDCLLSFLRSASKPEGESVEVEVRSPTARAVRRGRAANALSFEQRLRVLSLVRAMLAEISIN